MPYDSLLYDYTNIPIIKVLPRDLFPFILLSMTSLNKPSLLIMWPIQLTFILTIIVSFLQ